MTDQQRIGQLERDNSQLRQVVWFFLSQYYGRNVKEVLEALDRREASALENRRMIEQLIPLLKDNK